MRLQSKTSKVVNHLLKKGSLTTWQSIELFQHYKLPHTILVLRKAGYVITTQMIKGKDTEGNDREFAKYILVSTPKKQ
jgi:hypothetical protein